MGYQLKGDSEVNPKKPVTRKSCCWELNPSEKEILRAIFSTILELRKALPIEVLKLKTKKSADEIIRILDELEQKDVLLRNKGTQEIVSIYPISLTPTNHQVILEDGNRLFAMCALDAVGLPNLFNKNAEVISQCEWCKQKINLEIKNGQLTKKSHPDIHIWNTKDIVMPAAKTCCPLVNFFCSEKHLKEWENKNSDLSKKGEDLVLEKAYPENRDRWKSYAEMIGIR